MTAAALSRQQKAALQKENHGKPKASKAKPAAAPAPEPAAPLTNVIALGVRKEPGRLTTEPLYRLAPSPLNPRRKMNQEGLDRLGANIVEEGQIQSLVARPAKPGQFASHDGVHTPDLEIAAGARRWTSLLLKAQRGEIPWDFPVMVVIRDLTDSQLVELAGIENLGREDMDPLDEANLFDALRKTLKAEGVEGRPEEEVARRLGITSRTVFRRLALLNLAPEIQERIQSGDITLDVASKLTKASRDLQLVALDHLDREIKRGVRIDAEKAESIVNQANIPATRAFFDLKLYNGAKFEDPESGECWLHDRALFTELQTAAVNLKRADLRSKGIGVVIIERDHWWTPNDYKAQQTGLKYAPKTVPPGAQKAAVIHFSDRDLSVKVYDNLVKMPAPVKSSGKPVIAAGTGEIDPIAEVSTGRKIYAKQAKTRVLQDALFIQATTQEEPRLLFEQLALSLLGADGLMAVKFEDRGQENRVLGPLVQATLDKYRKALPATWKEGTLAPETMWTYGGDNHTGADKLHAALAELTTTDLRELVFALLAARCHTVVEAYNPQLGDRALAIDAANRLEIDMAASWSVDETYLATLKGEQLHDLYAVLHRWLIDRSMMGEGYLPPAEFGRLKVTERRAHLLEFVHTNAIRYVPPELRFRGRQAVEEGIKKLANSGGAKKGGAE